MMSFYPPSLPDDVLARSFRALNGEIGVEIADVPAFLDACRRDEIKVLGWELWLSDHEWDEEKNCARRVPVAGYWLGLIPDADGPPGVYQGEGDADQCQAEIAALDFGVDDLKAWQRYLRLNFTLDD